jgi:hypothetical protein
MPIDNLHGGQVCANVQFNVLDVPVESAARPTVQSRGKVTAAVLLVPALLALLL